MHLTPAAGGRLAPAFCLLTLGFGLWNASPALAQPANDACGDAVTVVNGIYNGTSEDASNDGQASCGQSASSPDVWYRYIAPASGTLTVDTCGDDEYNSVISVHTTCPGIITSQIGCNNDFCGLSSSLSVGVSANSTYWIRVSGGAGRDGPFVLAVNGPPPPPPPPANDACANAVVVVGGGTYNGTTVGALNDGQANCGQSASSPDVWYRYTAPSTGTLTVDTCDTSGGFNTVLSVHTTCPGIITSQVACEDSGCDTFILLARAQAPIAAGGTYYIRVAGFDGAWDAFTLSVTEPVPPVNDNCADAIVVTEGGYPFDTRGATTDGPADCAVNQDIWFLYTDTGDCAGNVAVAVDCNFSPIGRLAVYGSTDCSPTNLLACSTACGALTFTATPGTDYLIRVGRTGNSAGPGLLGINRVPPDNDACADALTVTDGVTAFTSCGAAGSEVWFHYVTERVGFHTVSLCGSSYDTWLTVCRPAVMQCDPWQCEEVYFNDDACGEQSEIRFDNQVPGNEYFILVYGPNNAAGPGILTITTPPVPPNDECYNPTVIIHEGMYVYTTDGASTGAYPTALCVGTLDFSTDIWFSFVAEPCVTDLLVSLCPSDFDTRLALYWKEECDPPPGRAGVAVCNDDNSSCENPLNSQLGSV